MYFSSLVLSYTFYPYNSYTSHFSIFLTFPTSLLFGHQPHVLPSLFFLTQYRLFRTGIYTQYTVHVSIPFFPFFLSLLFISSFSPSLFPHRINLPTLICFPQYSFPIMLYVRSLLPFNNIYFCSFNALHTNKVPSS